MNSSDVKTLAASLMKKDPEDLGSVNEAHFRASLRENLGFILSEHETITLCRAFGRKVQMPMTTPEAAMALLQAELKRRQFVAYADLITTLKVIEMSINKC